MAENNRRRLRRTTFAFWMLFFYIIAALIWWFISLEKQNTRLANEQLKIITEQKDSLSAFQYLDLSTAIEKEKARNSTKYILEGTTFFLSILVGAFFLFRAVRRQFKIQLQQQNFMMAVTHELKTPIAVARLNLETMQKYNLDPEKQKKIIRTTLDETERLNFLTNNILVSSQLEGQRNETDKEDLNLSDLLTDCLRDFRNRYHEREFLQKVEPDAEVKGDPLLLQMLINNLVENAIKYSPKDKPVKAILKQSVPGIILEVIDEGPGIPDEEKKKIFTKFYRIGNESTRKTQGTGLGLYLCRKIASEHNADISVTNNEPCGSIFTVIFKK